MQAILIQLMATAFVLPLLAFAGIAAKALVPVPARRQTGR